MSYSSGLSFCNKLLNRTEQKLKRNHLLSKPIELTLEPTLKCNSNCIMCNRNFNRKGDKGAEGYLSWEILRKVEPFLKYAERVLFGGFGEPLLHPEYVKMLRNIKKHAPFVQTFTNGILMGNELSREIVDAGMDMICVSIGGATRETYARIRGVDALDIVLKNIKLISDYKMANNLRTPVMSFNVVAMNSILSELGEIVNIASDLGVEHIALPQLVVQGSEIEHESIWLNKDNASEAFCEAKERADKLKIKLVVPDMNIMRKQCTDIFKRLNINWDGSVMSCAMERHIVGNVNEKSMNKIWNDSIITSLRKEYYVHGLERICPNCSCWDIRPETFLRPSVNSREYHSQI